MRIFRLSPFVLFALIAIAYAAWSWSTILGGFGGDNAYYLFMARHFSPYTEESAITAYFTEKSIYPPLFPLLLGLTGGGESLLAAHLVTTTFLLGAFGIFYWWVRCEDIGIVAACMTLLALALLPGIYFQTLSVHSENLYLLCSLTALACASKAQRQKTYIWLVIGVLAIGASYLTRSAGLALIVAWLAWLWCNRMPRRLLFSSLAILPVILWTQFGSTAPTNYWKHLANGYHDPANFLNQLALHGEYLFGGWLMNFGVNQTAFIAGVTLLACGFVAAAWRTKLGYLDGIYVWCYLAIILLWPFPAESQRFTLVLIPVLLFQSVWMVNCWQLSTSNLKPLTFAILGVLMAATLPEFALNLKRFFSPTLAGVPLAYKHAEWWYSPDPSAAISNIQAMAALESGMKELGKIVPENECIFAIKPSLVAYLSGRISKAPPGGTTNETAFEREIQSGGCQYFYMIIYTSPSYSVPLYPYQRIEDKLKVIKPTYLPASEGDNAIAGLLAKLK